ncbi:nitrile hydratase subunit alpha [Yoonia sediminilitoris]|uniref:Nitrile hydratase n=1 Tax=Yoonia sediminilitoris TaxID=1286148 RepID=A0A2T6KM76_9RHOB|nr:nitrile hydratase subunit alpha [Yoonia sediminilitoris]PUB17319.1 nitrile hydratase [Yoonia sediminilitoris]RCW97614.1 nitrile hydratase [Yoonia sediminilitoris]
MPHDHHHEEHEALVIEDDAGNIEAQIIVDALQEVLISKGLLTATEVTGAIAKLESPGIHLGAQVVARAWTDPAYKRRLLKDGRAAVQELDIPVTEARIIVVENTDQLHNLITCTLCSCYPRSILGQPPSWYISKAYRARSVREPRRVLAEFGLSLPHDVQLDVHDSNADMRYLVLPQPPADVARRSVQELEASISRDHLIGVAREVA